MTDFLSDPSASVYVVGHRAMVGAAIVRALEAAFITSSPAAAPNWTDATRPR